MIAIFFLIICLPGVFVVIEFFSHIITGSEFINRSIFIAVQISSLILLPTLYLGFSDIEGVLDCCSDSILFSPDHRLSLYCVIILCVIAYGISFFKKHTLPPLMELLVTCFLIIGIVLNIFISIHINEGLPILFGNIPIILLFFLALKKRHFIILNAVSEKKDKLRPFEKFCLRILQLSIYKQIPLLLLLCLPLLILLAMLLLVFGQKPDSMIRAFTDTFYHGFSQLDYACENIDCGGHYLCTIAAKGHKKFVKPERTGIRNGKIIVCNRQLLISNAFEELLQQKLPSTHGKIRSFYDKIGNIVNRYYSIFDNKYVSDLIYVLMKPLEWLFVIVLYTFDKNPENRIAQQYISKLHRRELNKNIKIS